MTKIFDSTAADLSPHGEVDASGSERDRSNELRHAHKKTSRLSRKGNVSIESEPERPLNAEAYREDRVVRDWDYIEDSDNVNQPNHDSRQGRKRKRHADKMKDLMKKCAQLPQADLLAEFRQLQQRDWDTPLKGNTVRLGHIQNPDPFSGPGFTRHTCMNA